MQTITPAHAVRDTNRKTTRLWFADDSPVPTGEYDIRGGICWPIPTPDGGIKGFAVVIGRHLSTNVYHWLDETEWICVDHVMEDGRVAFEGIAPWLNDVWRRFHLGQWYYHGDRELAFRYRTQIKKSEQIQPKPKMTEALWDRDEYAIAILREIKEGNRFAVPRDSITFQTEVVWSAAAPGSDMPGPMLALCSVLASMELYRWDGHRR